MLTIVAEDLWKTLEKMSKKSRRRLAAVAYLTSEERVQFDEGDVLVVDASDKALGGGLTSARMLARLRKRGVLLYSFPGLHAKVMVFDGLAFVGSANLTANSANLLEAGIVTDAREVVAGAEVLIESLRTHDDATEVDAEFVRRALRVPVVQRPPKLKRGKKRLVLPAAHRTWLLGIAPDDDETAVTREQRAKIARDENLQDGEVGSIRWPRGTPFAESCKRGESIIQVWSSRGEAQRPTYVYRPVTILRRVPYAKGVRVFIHDTEAKVRWGAFAAAWKSLVRGRLPGVNSERLMSDAAARALEPTWIAAVAE